MKTRGLWVKYPSEMQSFHAMRSRCYSPWATGYDDYGGRGIRVCERWLKSFSNFLEDLGPKPFPSHSLDRINTNGNYEPSNCRWATRKTQQNNRRFNHKLVIGGEILTAGEAAAEFGIPENTIRVWIYRHGTIAASLKILNREQGV